MEALEAKNITKRYTNHVALDNVSLTIPEKSIYGLLGPNGAGKTTLIRIVNQIINAEEGEVFIFGEKLKEKHVGTIGYLPEERGLYKKLKVGEQLLFLAQLKGMSRSRAAEQSKKWLKKFQISDWWNKKVEDLSKGMAQKVQFISTVMHEPKLIILDEPFSGFDPVNAKLITEEILGLRDNGSTIIFSTHRMETVEDLCDHIALINKSKKIVDGPKKEVKDQYKSNTFIVEHHGNHFQLAPEKYQILNQETLEENHFITTIKASQEIKANQVIRELIDKTQLQSFREKIPSMADIFIDLVKGEEDEATLRQQLQDI